MGQPQRYNQSQLWVLGQIKDKSESTKSDIITYNLALMSAREGAPDTDTQRDILFGFQHDGIIQLKPIFGEDIFVQPKAVSGGFEIEPTGFRIKILHPQFEESIVPSSKKSTPPLKNSAIELTAGDLTSHQDGTIRYKSKIIKITPQMKDLCRLFMESPNRLITVDDIKDEIIRADRRKSISYSTISKYVSRLHNSLKIHYHKKVIFNHRTEGWHFMP